MDQLDAALQEASYNTFDSLYQQLAKEAFSEDDLPYLKATLTRDYAVLSPILAEKYYQATRSLLSTKEQKKILAILKNYKSDRLIELVDMLRMENRAQESIDMIKTWLSDHATEYMNDSQKVYFLYLDLLKAENRDLVEAAKDAISRCATCAMIQKIAVLLPDDIRVYEDILESKGAEEMLDYLEASERLEEGLTLIKRSQRIWESRIDKFSKQHKKKFPEEAMEFFSDIINKNLQHTGDRYYYAIADALKQIRKIDTGYTNALLADIRLNYKRRRNLMTILAKL